MVRCFEDDDVTHVEGRIDPIADIETIETELMLADLDSLETARRRAGEEGQGQRQGSEEAKEALDLINRALALLREGKPARLVERKPEEEKAFHPLGLLTSLPVLYVCNVDEGSAATGNELSRKVEARAKAGRRRLRRDLGQDRSGDRGAARPSAPILSSRSGLKEPGLDRLIRAGYDLLHLVTFFTAGPKEARAWTITRGTKGPQAAGVIHTDFERGFIRAETIAYDDYRQARRRGRRARRRQAAAGRQGLCRRRRRRDALPVCDVSRVIIDALTTSYVTFARGCGWRRDAR